MQLLRCVLCLMLISCSSMASANVVIVVGNRDGSMSTFNAGSTVTLSVWGYENPFDADFPTKVSAYDLYFDLGGDGIGIPGTPDFFTNLQVNFSGRELVTGGSPEFSTNDPAADLLATNFGGASQPNLPGTLLTAKKLFDISFSVSSSTTGGIYQLAGISPISKAQSDTYGYASVIFQQDSGSSVFGKFQINGQEVPEPTTITLLAIGLAGGVACRRFRKRSSSVGPGTTDPSTNEAKV